MAVLRMSAQDSILVVVDIQDNFLAPIWEKERVLDRASFLIKTAKLLNVPIVATEQVPEKMGGTCAKIKDLLPASTPIIPKAAFGCMECKGFDRVLASFRRPHVVLVGIETHICVTLTALGLLSQGTPVAICADAVSSRTQEMHKLGMERMRDSGAVATHTETVAYEWMQAADHSKFREMLQVVKAHSG